MVECTAGETTALIRDASHESGSGINMAKDCILLAQDPVTQRIVRYDGYDVSLAFVKDYIALHGPFDGFWAFSQACTIIHPHSFAQQVINLQYKCCSDPVWFLQGTILASLLLGMKQQGLILQA